MGCSASRLSRTRSGVVRFRVLLLGMGRLPALRLARRSRALPLAAPVPPMALGGRETGIARLRHGGGEGVEHAGIRALAGYPTEPLVKMAGLLAGKLRHAADAQPPKIPQHGRPNGDEVGKF